MSLPAEKLWEKFYADADGDRCAMLRVACERIVKLEGMLRVILSQDPLAGDDPSKVTIWGQTMDSVRKELAND